MKLTKVTAVKFDHMTAGHDDPVEVMEDPVHLHARRAVGFADEIDIGARVDDSQASRFPSRRHLDLENAAFDRRDLPVLALLVRSEKHFREVGVERKRAKFFATSLRGNRNEEDENK